MIKSHKLQVEHVSSPDDCIVLDLDFLNLNTFGDIVLRTEILGLFRAQVNGAALQLQFPVNPSGWHYLTHTLKGAAAAVGAGQLAALADTWGRNTSPKTQSARIDCETQLTLAMAHFNRVADQLDL